MPHHKHASALADQIASCAQTLEGQPSDHDALLALIGDARVVMLGEASHGTHEFYQERARITQRLVLEKRFTGIAVEADWPDAYRVNRYVRAQGTDRDSREALSGFLRFPTWMWRNQDVLAFVDWLRAHNDAQSALAHKVGFYGLDLYSLFTSIGEVLRYLEKVDPAAAKQARARYACFDHFGEDSQHYGYATGFGLSASCEHEVVTQLRELQARASDYLQEDGAHASDAFFHAQQNALLIQHAEAYYRTMFRGRISSWNLRDQHMAQTLDALLQHLSRQSGQPAKLVVWAHNSHIGDARATEMGSQGEWNVGQLARERHGDAVRLIGFTTYAGTVTAASDWDQPAERKRVRPALPGSCEAAFHQTGIARFMLPLRGRSRAADALAERRLQRAIGVIYRPETERQSHYVHVQLPLQFDAVLHFDQTHALTPLEPSTVWHAGEAPETFPQGI